VHGQVSRKLEAICRGYSLIVIERYYLNLDVSETVDIASILIVGVGFALGLGHSLDPDHVVAVSTLLCNSTSLRKSVVSAAAWGAGHSVTLFIVGFLVLALRIAIPENVVRLFEFAAGAMLILLGMLVVKPFVASKIRRRGRGIESDPQTQAQPRSPVESQTHLPKSVFTGVLQGLAGSAALMLVTLTTVESAAVGLVFILMFGVGVILGMVSVACLIGSLFAFTSLRLKKVHETLLAVTGSVSIGFGVFIIMQAALQYRF